MDLLICVLVDCLATLTTVLELKPSLCLVILLVDTFATKMTERLALAGVFTAIVTPFSADGSVVDWKGLEDLVEAQIQGGVDGLYVWPHFGDERRCIAVCRT